VLKQRPSDLLLVIKFSRIQTDRSDFGLTETCYELDEFFTPARLLPHTCTSGMENSDEKYACSVLVSVLYSHCRLISEWCKTGLRLIRSPISLAPSQSHNNNIICSVLVSVLVKFRRTASYCDGANEIGDRTTRNSGVTVSSDHTEPEESYITPILADSGYSSATHCIRLCKTIRIKWFYVTSPNYK